MLPASSRGWYFFKHGGPYEAIRLESVDPGGVIADNLPLDRMIASVVYAAAAIERPGVIRHIEGNRFSLTEIDGSKSERILRVSTASTRSMMRRAELLAPWINQKKQMILRGHLVVANTRLKRRLSMHVRDKF
jgi:hypothetical protein